MINRSYLNDSTPFSRHYVRILNTAPFQAFSVLFLKFLEASLDLSPQCLQLSCLCLAEIAILSLFSQNELVSVAVLVS